MIDTAGNIATVAGNDILVASTASSGQIFRIDPKSGDASILISGGELQNANITGLEFACDRSLVVSTFDRIVRIDLSTLKQTRVAGRPVIQDPLPTFWTDVALTTDGRLFATVEKSAAFAEVDVTTGEVRVIDLGAPPNSLEPGPENAVYVLAGDTIVRFDPSTGTHDVVVETNAFSNDFAVAQDATVYAVRQQEVLRFVPASQSLETVSSGGHLENPHGIAIEACGNLLVTDLANDSLIRVDPGSGVQNVLARNGILSSLGRLVVTPT